MTIQTGAPESARAAARNSIMRDGLTAGVLGATAVAALFFIVDLLRGQPFLVPAGLGHQLLHAFGLAGNEGMLLHVIAYSLFHYVAFALVGIAAAMVARRAEQQPALLAGAFLLFVVFEAGFWR